ncbi:MAG: hypothetical protein [Anelloviridae sp.]|nr:MAG: hypothetical protein [Anelloviridae sp.]
MFNISYRLWTPQPEAQNTRNRRGDIRGRNASTDGLGQAPAPPVTAQAAQAPTQAINLKIIKLKTSMFGDDLTRNRRLTPKELEDELLTCRIWKRRPRSYIRDHPYYDPIFEPLVNFKLFNK